MLRQGAWWYENLKKHFLKWEEENPDKCWKPDTLLFEDEYMETLGSDDVNQEEREDDDLRDTSENNDEETTYNNTSWNLSLLQSVPYDSRNH